MARIFLCHASEDKPQVEAVYERLRALGWQPWMDKDLLPGQRWQQEIPRVLKESDFILIFFSRKSVAKQGYVQREFKLALDMLQEIPEDQIHTIPIRLDACDIPPQFEFLQWCNFFEDNGFERMVQAIRAGLSQRQSPDPRAQSERLERLENGDLFLSFSIRGFVGRGGFSDSYIAWDRVNDRECLLKLFGTENQPDIRKKFVEREIKMARLIPSAIPNLVNSYEIIPFQGGFCFVQERIPGESLFERIKARGILSLEEAITTTVKLCEPLEHLHKLRIAHCDIKPHNIIINSPGNPTLIDLGTARFFDEEIELDNIVVSIPYSSEDLMSGKPIDGRVDIYSLGMTLLHMLTDQDFTYLDPDYDWNNFDVYSMPKNLTLGDHRQPTKEEIAEYVKQKMQQVRPESLCVVISRALSIEPENQYSDVSQFCSALKGIVQS